MSASPRWACAACGCRTQLAPPPGTGVRCPVCGWVDAAEQPDTCGRWRWAPNAVHLRDAQRNVLSSGAIDPAMLGEVRAPLPEEARAGDWRTLDVFAEEARGSLRAEIAAAFDGVARAGGVSLHETTAIVDSCGADDPERQAARARDTESCWQDVPNEDLAVPYAHSMFDPIGWRYYLPAYMTWWLSGGEQSGSSALGSFFYGLMLGEDGLRDRRLERYRGLGARQAAVVARFLRFVERFAESDWEQSCAITALAGYWGASAPQPDARQD